MPADLMPSDVEIADSELYVPAEEAEDLRQLDRTPRPYYRDGVDVEQYKQRSVKSSRPEVAIAAAKISWPQGARGSVVESESGTEADDERPSFVKALPAPHLRPRKGLKTGEASADVLLTPSQLDEEERSLQGYFKVGFHDTTPSQEEQDSEQRRLLRVRWAEFTRRSSEVGLIAVVILSVLCGRDVWQTARLWPRELVAHLLIMATLIVAYPVKLAIVDSRSQNAKVWHRVRVPASFDPATVLYPPLLPVLVALSACPMASAAILPNVILGLSSLPQRLFPRTSRIGGINVLHWFVSIIPLIVSEYTARPWKHHVPVPYMIKSGPTEGLAPESLASLYPLHHALMQPLHYLTTSSLLVSELHLLSTGLINILILARSPQAVIMKACLWIGGIPLLVLCNSVLHWNVMLMRIPKWKFRRSGSSVASPNPLINAVTGLVTLRQAAAVWKGVKMEGSDADEDGPGTSFKHALMGRHKPTLSRLTFDAFSWIQAAGPRSAVESRMINDDVFAGSSESRERPRRNTSPIQQAINGDQRRGFSTHSTKAPRLPWYIHLTSEAAELKKWINAIYVYGCIAVTVLVPVRRYAMERALGGREPIGWALGYLLGQLVPLRDVARTLGLDQWLSLPQHLGTELAQSKMTTLDVASVRATLGASNVRLLLIAYWAIVLLLGLLTVFSLTAYVEVDTRRKVFHGVMVAMLLPATFVDPCACALALALILAVFLLLEVVRAGQLVPLGTTIGRFVAPYVDGRDLRGPVVVSHIFLLIGCAVPLWFSLASVGRVGESPWTGWELPEDVREVAMVAGVICVGMGDAAASLVGRRYGKHKWIWVGGKSLEGSAAFAVAVTIGLVTAKAWLIFGGWIDMDRLYDPRAGPHPSSIVSVDAMVSITKAAFCACATSFMEAVLTGANDNVVVPIVLWLLVKGVRL